MKSFYKPVNIIYKITNIDLQRFKFKKLLKCYIVE